jgi:hypothetical protein
MMYEPDTRSDNLRLFECPGLVHQRYISDMDDSHFHPYVRLPLLAVDYLLVTPKYVI